jgi:FHS family glucose/mannose:H+ symporter-like MFS transporter
MDAAIRDRDRSTIASRSTLSRLIATAPLYFGFLLTGVGVALPGALLPVLLIRWHLQDEQAGRLFLMAWMGSSLGALFTRGSLRTTLLGGFIAIALGAAVLGFCAGHQADAWMAIYGVGLGLTMTSISLIRHHQAGGDGTELVRLNLLWAVGACACPSLMIHALTTGNIRPVFLGLAICFAGLCLWAIFCAYPYREAAPIAVADRTYTSPWTVFRLVPPGLIVMTLLSPGIEASAGGWLATYAKRGGHGITEAVAAPSCFWAGLLLSRLFWSVFDRWLSHDWTVRCSAGLMAAASVLLVTSHSGTWMIFAAFCMGFGIGPTYPLLLAWALRFHRGGTIFFLAGIASSFLPWLTGFVSARQQSLRVGLAVPMAATLAMVTLSLLLPLKRWSQIDAKAKTAALLATEPF